MITNSYVRLGQEVWTTHGAIRECRTETVGGNIPGPFKSTESSVGDAERTA